MGQEKGLSKEDVERRWCGDKFDKSDYVISPLLYANNVPKKSEAKAKLEKCFPNYSTLSVNKLNL